MTAPRSLNEVLGPSTPDAVILQVADALARLLVGDLRTAPAEGHAIVISCETAHLERRELLAADLRRARSRELARRVDRFHVPAGGVLVVLFVADEPELRALDVEAMRRFLGTDLEPGARPPGAGNVVPAAPVERMRSRSRGRSARTSGACDAAQKASR